MDVPPWLYLLEAVVVTGVVVYVLIREQRMDERRSAAGAGDQTSQRSGDLLPRLGARLIDQAPFWIIYTALNLAFNIGSVLVVAYVVVVYAYFVLLDTYAGTTLGKRLLRLRVIGPTGDKPGITQAAMREAFIVVTAVVSVIPYVGDSFGSIVSIAIAWTISSSPTKQGAHDQIGGGTRVVRVQPVAATGLS